MIVPNNTIAYYTISRFSKNELSDKDVSIFLKPLNTSHKRDWFTPFFYKCLPLSIGNMQGFIFSVPFDFDVFWNGKDSVDDLKITYKKIKKEDYLVDIKSEFGSGIFTIHFPLILKTPPGVNLMTIAPPNFPTPGLSPLTGVVESDNLKFTFTLNIKVDLVGMNLSIPANTPLMGMIPVPRYFCDSFELKNAYDIFDSIDIDSEKAIVEEHSKSRDKQVYNELSEDGLYFKGMDIRGNSFEDHQLPRKQK